MMRMAWNPYDVKNAWCSTPPVSPSKATAPATATATAAAPGAAAVAAAAPKRKEKLPFGKAYTTFTGMEDTLPALMRFGRDVHPQQPTPIGESSKPSRFGSPVPEVVACYDNLHFFSYLKVTYLPSFGSDFPIQSLPAGRFTPDAFPVGRDKTDKTYYPMMMGGTSSCPARKADLLQALSAISGESIGLMDMFLFPDGFLQEHSGGHVVFFYVQGASAVENVKRLSKCFLATEEDIFFVAGSSSAHQAENILRTLQPIRPDGSEIKKLGHPCPIESKTGVPERRPAPLKKHIQIPQQHGARNLKPAGKGCR